MGAAAWIQTLAVLMMAACSGPASLASPPAEPASVPTEGAPQPSAPQGEHALAPDEEMGSAIVVERDHLLLDGVRIERNVQGKVGMVPPLFDTLRGSSGRDASGALIAKVGDPRPYELQVGKDVPMAWLKSVFQTAAFAGQRPATLWVKGQSILLQPLIALPSMVDAEDLQVLFQNPTLMMTVREEGAELWVARHPPAPGEPAPPADRVLQLASSAKFEELEAAFVRQCAQSACSPAVLFTSDAIHFERVQAVLGAFAAATTRPGQAAPVIEFRIIESPKYPAAPGPISRVRFEGASVSGKLAPELIGSTVRANYDRLRKCYEAGRKEDPELRGRIMLRVMIARDGVPSATVAETDLPEAVSQCVVTEFRGIVFPHPEGGVVTVIYPIQFQPE